MGAVLAIVLGGCGAKEPPLAPPEIVYGEDVCDQCGMIISEERFAAATLVEADGTVEPRRFDDIGELMDYAGAHPELTVVRWYVHDYDTLEWLEGPAATYVRAADLRTPMGYGLAAFGDPARAAQFSAERSGEILSMGQLLDAAAKVSSEEEY
jgi:copper chaperone NosL